MVGDFGQYIGVDVSPQMVRMASAYQIPRASFHAVSGADLRCIPDVSIDFVFSFAVFQHVPDLGAIYSDSFPKRHASCGGGVFRLQTKGLWSLVLGNVAIEAGLSPKPRLGPVRFPFARVRHLDTWQGRALAPPTAVRECGARGLKVDETEGKWTVLMWLGGHKE